MKINTNLSGQPLSQTSERANSQSPLSADRVKKIRSDFESENQSLQQSLGSEGFQATLVAVYEGTEHMVNKPLSEFDIASYLETIKDTAQSLSVQGVGISQMRSTLMQRAKDEAYLLLKNI